jgi:hypothetical protein
MSTDDPITAMYAAPPDGFVAARDAAVAAAREAGQAQRAREIAKLRKPTVAAWVVNLLAIRRSDLVDELVDLAAAMRSAQRQLKGDQLRELSAQRREAVNGLLREAVKLAGEADPRNRGKLPQGEVEATLNAAMSDAEVAEQVRSGRLIKAATYAGFGEVPRPQLRLVTAADLPDEPAPAKDTDKDDDDRDGDSGSKRVRDAERAARRRALLKELTAARTDEKRAETEAADAAQAEQDGTQAVADAEAAVAEAERAQAEAEAALSRLKVARKTAERAATAARRRVGEVEAAMEAFDADDEGDDA